MAAADSSLTSGVGSRQSLCDAVCSVSTSANAGPPVTLLLLSTDESPKAGTALLVQQGCRRNIR
jgi:hypothetical protein